VPETPRPESGKGLLHRSQRIISRNLSSSQVSNSIPVIAAQLSVTRWQRKIRALMDGSKLEEDSMGYIIRNSITVKAYE